MRSRIEATRRIEAILRQRGSPLARLLQNLSNVRKLPRHFREKIVDELAACRREKPLYLESTTYGSRPRTCPL